MTNTARETFVSTCHASPETVTLFLIFLLSTLTYVDIVNHQFVTYDDTRIILSRSDTFDGLTLKNIKNIVVDDYPREEPLIVRDLSYLINGSIFGALNSQGYLLGNLLLHMVASYLVFAVSLVLFPNRYWQAIITAVLFAIHPIHVESVAWASSRKDTLYSCFFLAGLLAYNRFLKANRPCSLLLAMSLGCYIFALFSKLSAIAFVPIALLYRCLIVPNKKWEWRETCFVVLLAASSLLFIQWYSRVLTEFGLFELQNNPSLFKVNPATWLLLNIEAVTFYLGKLLYPKTLSIIYDFPSPNVIFKYLPYLLLSLAVFTVLLFCLLKALKKTDKRPLFLILWFFIVLGPYLNWAGINIFIADRYLYLAAFAPISAVSFMLTAIINLARQYQKAAGNAAIVMVCLLIAALTTRGITAVHVWSNTTTLWNNAMKVAPYHVEPFTGLLYYNMSVYMHKKGTPEGQEALALAKTIATQGYQKYCNNGKCPKQAAAILYYLAEIYYFENDMTKSEQFLQKGLWLKPEDIHLNYMHAYLAINRGNYQEAKEDLEFVKSNANPHEHANILAELRTSLEPLVSEKLKAQ